MKCQTKDESNLITISILIYKMGKIIYPLQRDFVTNPSEKNIEKGLAHSNQMVISPYFPHPAPTFPLD